MALVGGAGEEVFEVVGGVGAKEGARGGGEAEAATRDPLVKDSALVGVGEARFEM